MAGTTDEVKQAIVETLRAIYPRGLTDSGISTTCFKGKTGADGQALIGYLGNKTPDKALKELIVEGTVISYGDDGHGQAVFHYKTDEQAPVVGQKGEIKLAIIECLCRIYPRELVRVGIELECFKNKYGLYLIAANGLPLGGDIEGEDIQSALDELVADGKIEVRTRERDGTQMAHYVAKPDGFAPPF